MIKNTVTKYPLAKKCLLPTIGELEVGTMFKCDALYPQYTFLKIYGGDGYHYRFVALDNPTQTWCGRASNDPNDPVNCRVDEIITDIRITAQK